MSVVCLFAFFFGGGGGVVAGRNVALLLQENASSEEHVVYVWDHFVSKAEAKNVFIVAHSYGGLSFVELVSTCFFFFPSSHASQPANRATQSIANVHVGTLLYTSEHQTKHHTLSFEVQLNSVNMAI